MLAKSFFFLWMVFESRTAKRGKSSNHICVSAVCLFACQRLIETHLKWRRLHVWLVADLLKCVWVSLEPEAVAEQTHKQWQCRRSLSGMVSEWMTPVCWWLRDTAVSRDLISEDKSKVFIDAFLFTLIASAVCHYKTLCFHFRAC